MLALTCWLCGCPSSPSGPEESDQPKLPDLGSIRSRLPAQVPSDMAERGETVRVRATQLVLPMQPPLAPAWQFARSKGIEPPAVALWRKNGLYACVVHKGVLKEFFSQIPEPVNRGQQRLLASRLHAPLQSLGAGVIRQRQRATVVLPGDEEEKLTFDRGICRLLLQAEPQDDGTVLLYLTPQHHRPRTSIKPRSMLEKQLDGRIFHELRLQARLSGDRVLLVGLAPEPEQEPEEEELAEEKPATTDAKEPTPEDAPQVEADLLPQPHPRNIGRLILQGTHGNSRMQLLVVVVIE